MHERADEFGLQVGSDSVAMVHIPCGLLCIFGRKLALDAVMAAVEDHLADCPLVPGSPSHP